MKKAFFFSSSFDSDGRLIARGLDPRSVGRTYPAALDSLFRDLFTSWCSLMGRSLAGSKDIQKQRSAIPFLRETLKHL